MILSSPLQDNKSSEIALTGPWVFTGNGAKASGARATFAAAPEAGGTSLFVGKSHSVGVKLSSVPFYFQNATGNGLVVYCGVDGLLRFSRYSTEVIDLVAMGVDITKPLTLELHFEYAPAGYTCHLYINGYKLSTMAPYNTSWGLQPLSYWFEANGSGSQGQVTVRDIYFKDGAPLRNWNVTTLKGAITDVQGAVGAVPSTLGSVQTLDDAARIGIKLVGQQPLTGTLAQLSVRTPVTRARKYDFEHSPVVSLGGLGAHTPITDRTLRDLSETSALVIENADASIVDNGLVLSFTNGSKLQPKSEPVSAELRPFALFRFLSDATDEVSLTSGTLNNATAAGLLTTDAAVTSNMTFPAFVPGRDFTIETKFDYTQLSNGVILRCGDSWSLFLDTTLKFKVELGHSTFVLDSGVTPASGVEHHVAVVGQQGTVSLYVNGTQTSQAVLFGKIRSTSGVTYIAEGYAGTTRDMRLCFSAQYQGDFAVADLPEFTRPTYSPVAAYAIVAQEEFFPGTEYGVLDYVPPEPEPEPELPPEPEPPLIDPQGDWPVARYTFADGSLADEVTSTLMVKPSQHTLSDNKLHTVATSPGSYTTRGEAVHLPDDAFTVEFKVNLKSSTPTSGGHILHRYGSTDATQCWGIGIDTDFKPYFTFDDVGLAAGRLTARDPLVPMQDSHIAVVNFEGSFILFVNGVRQPGTIASRPINKGEGTATNPLSITNIAAASIWDVSISHAALYSEDFTVAAIPPIPIVPYTPEEESKVALQIQFRDGNTTLEDSKVRTVAKNITPNGRYMTHGTNAYYDVAQTPYFGEADFTVECMFNSTGPSAGVKSLVGDWNTAAKARFNVFLNGDGTVGFNVSLDGTQTNIVTLTSMPFEYNKDNHVVVERVGDTISMYINGVLQGTMVHAAPMFSPGAVGTVGSRFNSAVVTVPYTIWNIRIVNDSLFKGKVLASKIFSAFRSIYAITSSYAQVLVEDTTPQPTTEYAITSSYAQVLVEDQTPQARTTHAVTSVFAQVLVKL